MESISSLIYDIYDYSIKNISVVKKSDKTIVELVTIKPYNDKSIKYIFDEVISIEFASNIFEENFGSELMGIYEISSNKVKIEILESNFERRKKGYLLNNDYNYLENDQDDLLNNRYKIENVSNQINDYVLYQVETTGGIYYIICKSIERK